MTQSLASLNQTKFMDGWNHLSPARKIGLAVLIAAAVGGLIFFSTWMQTPSYATAFTDLQAEDGAAIIEYLKENNIPYEVTNNGQTIRVPTSQVHETRLALAGQGLPDKGTVGFELFDTANLGMTDFTQQVNYQRALEGELARTIGSLEAVRSARVHIVIPQPTLFSDEEKQTTASIVIDMEPGQQLNREQVLAISHLVSSAVEGLTPENLTLVDMEGNMLVNGSSSVDTAPLALTASQLETQHDFERSLEQRIEAMLKNVLGPNKATVGVTAVMNWDQVETESETYQPGEGGQGVIRSSRYITETQAGSEDGASGVPGTATNLTDAASTYQTAISGTNGSGYIRTDLTTNYEISRSVSHIVPATGQIERLSVSVMVDNITDTVTLNAIQQATIAAAGIDQARGDVLTVSSVPFDRTFDTEQQLTLETAEQREFYLKLAQWGAIAIALLALFFVVRSTQRTLRPQPIPIVPRELPAPTIPTVPLDARTALLEEVSKANADIPEDRMQGLDTIGPPTFDAQQQGAAEKAQMLRQLQLMAKNRPETLAQIIEFWIAEDENK
ncbi:MAG: flagellar M-ring protein FliF [Anaerolineales bacterium]|nr:flagellar M-ring protein FliF [Anaerolineales bacterium]